MDPNWTFDFFLAAITIVYLIFIIIMLHINNQMPEIGKIFGEIGRSHEGNRSCDMIYIVCQPFRRIKKIAV